MQNSIVVKHLSKAYGEHTAISDISFTIKKGEIFALLGPNGAGKSTTIAILSTLLSFDDGSVEMDGYLLGKQDDAIRKKLGIVFQGSMLDPTLSVAWNLKIRCGLYGLYAHKADERIKILTQQCHLQDFLHQKVNELSGGQRRKVDIARALIPRPDILILDEPSSGLDPQARKELWSMIQQLHHEEMMTIFMTTHYMEETVISDHIALIQKGRIIINGSRQELLQQFQKDHLHVYTDTIRNVMHELSLKKISFIQHSNYIDIEIINFYQLMSILRSCERYIRRIELRKGSMEDMYLNILEDENL